MESFRTYYNGSLWQERWPPNGPLYRKDGPARIRYFENGQVRSHNWYLNGKRHRDDGPAIIRYFENGQIASYEWYLNGKSHREDDPSTIKYFPDGSIYQKWWKKNGNLDKEKYNGLVWVEYNGGGDISHILWFINGKKIQRLRDLLNSTAPIDLKIEMKLLYG